MDQANDGRDATLKSTVEAWKRDVDAKFDKMVATATAQASAISDLKVMFVNYIGKSKGIVEGSPSITESALENEHSAGGGSRGALAPTTQPLQKGAVNSEQGDNRVRKSKGKKTGAAQGDQLASKTALTLSFDSDVMEVSFKKPMSPRWKVDARETTPPPLPEALTPSEVVVAQTVVAEPLAPLQEQVSPDPYTISPPDQRTCASLPSEPVPPSSNDSPGPSVGNVDPARKINFPTEAPQTVPVDTDKDPAAREDGNTGGDAAERSSEEHVQDGGNVEVIPDEGGQGGFEDALSDRAITTNVAAAPSKKAKKAPKSPSKVCISQPRSPCAFVPGVTLPTLQDLVTNRMGGSSNYAQKLIIFNVQGTLLDCSLLSSPNPNTSIRASLTVGSRRVVF